MDKYTVRLNKKIKRTEKQRRRSLRSIKSNKISGVTYGTTTPDLNTCTSALFVNQHINKIFFNGDDKWYAIDRTAYYVPALKSKHIIFNQRKLMFLDLFYYNGDEKIYLPDLMNIEITGDIIIDEIPGYVLYVSYIEVL